MYIGLPQVELVPAGCDFTVIAYTVRDARGMKPTFAAIDGNPLTS